MSDPLALATRGGIPDEIAYLRARHPGDAWRTHAGFGELCDFWLHVHAALRAEGAAVERAIADLREGRIDPHGFAHRFVPTLNQFLGHLDAHHRIEDAAYFPKFRLLDPCMDRGFDLLEADHAAIHAALDTVVTTANGLLAALGSPDARPRAADDHAAAAQALTRLLLRHLADEEDLVIPAMLEHGERRVR